MKCIHTWQENVCAVLRAGIRRAVPTGSPDGTKALVTFDVAVLENLLADAPFETHTYPYDTTMRYPYKS